MSNRSIFAIMFAFAAAAIAGLWFLIKSGADDPPAATATTQPARGSSAFAGPDHRPAPSPGQPQLPAPPVPDNLPPKIKEYADNGAIIRDHRTGTHEPFEGAGSGAANTGRKIDVAVTKAVADKVRDAVRECAAAAPAGSLTDGKLEGVLNIAIKDKQVSVNQASFNVRGASGDAAERARACIVQKSMTITQAAGDEADLASYDITLSLNLI